MALVEEQVNIRKLPAIPKKYQGVDPFLENGLAVAVQALRGDGTKELPGAEADLGETEKILEKAKSQRAPNVYYWENEVFRLREKCQKLRDSISKQEQRLDSILAGTFGKAREEISEARDRLEKSESALTLAEEQAEKNTTIENVGKVSEARNFRDTCRILLRKLESKLSGVKENERKEKARTALAEFETETPQRMKGIQKRAAAYVEAIEKVREIGQGLQRDFDAFQSEMERAGVDGPGSLFLQTDSPLRWLMLLVARDWSEPTKAMYIQELSHVTNAADELEKIIQGRIKKAWSDLDKPPAKRSPFLVTPDGYMPGVVDDPRTWEKSEGGDNAGDLSKQRLSPINPPLSELTNSNSLFKGK